MVWRSDPFIDFFMLMLMAVCLVCLVFLGLYFFSWFLILGLVYCFWTFVVCYHIEFVFLFTFLLFWFFIMLQDRGGDRPTYIQLSKSTAIIADFFKKGVKLRRRRLQPND
jgi:uncharacterized membrane protein